MPQLLRVVAACSAAWVAFVGLLPAAGANGRFPTTTGVQFRPDDNQTLVVPATFGLLVSTDDGATFHWVCEEAVGYAGTYDPAYAVAADGAIFATNFQGVRVSRDGACTWDEVADLSAHWVSDVQVASNGTLWASTFTAGVTNDIYTSNNNGASFASAGLPRDDVWFRSLRIAPGDANRIYASGLVFTEPEVDGGFPVANVIGFWSENGGASWQQMGFAGVEVGAQPQWVLMAVSPEDPDVLYARSEKANVPIGDILYRSTDKGQTWTEVLRMTDTIRAVVARSGGTVIAGSLNDGVQLSSNSGDTWMRPPQQPPMNCLGERSDGTLFACSLNWAPTFFALGTSTDGMTWTPMMRFCEIQAPLSCAPGTIQHDTCEQKRWDAVVAQVSVGDCDAPPGSDAGVSFADAAIADARPLADAGVTKPPEGCGGCSGSAAFIALFPLGFRRRRRAGAGCHHTATKN